MPKADRITTIGGIDYDSYVPNVIRINVSMRRVEAEYIYAEETPDMIRVGKEELVDQGRALKPFPPTIGGIAIQEKGRLDNPQHPALWAKIMELLEEIDKIAEDEKGHPEYGLERLTFLNGETVHEIRTTGPIRFSQKPARNSQTDKRS